MECNSRDQVHISVRGLVEFVLRSGNIDNRHKASPENAMQEGSRIHRMIQRKMGAGYEAEVPLKLLVAEEEFDILIDGRADGIVTESDGQITVDEIKGIYKDLVYLEAPFDVHLAQAKCYAYIYAKDHDLREIKVRMTYCNIDTEEIRYFHFCYTYAELAKWFGKILDEYRKWAHFTHQWRLTRRDSIKKLSFPFPYRTGQKELAAHVYRTIYHGKRLFIEAPTGVGKTISTVFPAVKAVGEGLSDKIFYLTAKTITATVAEDTFSLLRRAGLSYKTVTLTAKEKICFQEETECNPDVCPFAKGHYDRINDAIFELLTTQDEYSRETIREYAEKHRVCPFELCLDMSLFSDAVICDYNYVFDPNVYLRRFFGEGVKGEYLFLVDEAHNLVERGREMYSAVLYKEQFLTIKKLVKGVSKTLERAMDACNSEMLKLKRECGEFSVFHSIEPFILALTRAASKLDKWLEEEEGSAIRKEVFEFYMEVRHFLSIYEGLDRNYVIYGEMTEEGAFLLKLFCVHPAANLRMRLDKGNSTIFFSATLLPMKYYMNLLSGEETDYAVYAESSFDESRRGLFIGTDVSSRYKRRGPMEYYNIASYIAKVARAHRGNYLVFFPSHSFLREVYDIFREYFANEDVEIKVQEPSMSERDREEFLDHFRKNVPEQMISEEEFCRIIHMEIEMEEQKSLVGFCVMGGIFSEGIDLKKDSLIGALVVGTGLPQVCHERELLKDYFTDLGMNGFDYAYCYPGMNKVLQSAGRVIRTAEDRGVVLLLDERFAEGRYRRLFPREWKNIRYVTAGEIDDEIRNFWDTEEKEGEESYGRKNSNVCKENR